VAQHTPKTHSRTDLVRTGASSGVPAPASLHGTLPTYQPEVTDQASLDAALARAATADEAFAILNGSAGLIPFANKAALAQSGQRFNILNLAIRNAAGYTGDDDVAATIELLDRSGNPSGVKQLLTFEQNPTRNAFMLGAHGVIQRFGYLPNAALQSYPKKDGTSFYAIVPAAMWTGQGSTIEGELIR
jgi:hypothetical protein